MGRRLILMDDEPARRTKRIQATARKLSVMSLASCARRRLIRDVLQKKNNLSRNLMFGFKKKKTVRVQFFEQGTSEPFAVSDMPPEQLTESFVVDTMMHIGEDNWLVVRAEPSSRTEAAAHGRLDLYLNKVIHMAPKDISYSQVDITEIFDDHLRLSPQEWVATAPLSSMVDRPELQGLPSKKATPEEVYEVAQKLSAIRETFSIENDGVYCPVCHIANTDLGRLKTPCPKCNRELLMFGWK
jgi:hypothetical protein